MEHPKESHIPNERKELNTLSQEISRTDRAEFTEQLKNADWVSFYANLIAPKYPEGHPAAQIFAQLGNRGSDLKSRDRSSFQGKSA